MLSCVYHSYLKSLVPDNRADVYFLIFVLNIFIIYAIYKHITELIMVIVDLIIFLIIKSVIYNDESSAKVDNISSVVSTRNIISTTV